MEQVRPESASEFWISKRDLETIEVRDEYGRITKKDPIRRWVTSGDPVVVWKESKKRFYYEGGGEPIPFKKMATVFRHIPFDEALLEEELKIEEDKKALEVKAEEKEDLNEDAPVYEEVLVDHGDVVVQETTIEPEFQEEGEIKRGRGRPPKRDK